MTDFQSYNMIVAVTITTQIQEPECGPKKKQKRSKVGIAADRAGTAVDAKGAHLPEEISER